MSDRVAVFNLGRIEQIGTPVEIYDRPATAFVAGFVGVSNTYDAAAARRLFGIGSAFTIRPERIRLLPPTAMLPPGMDGAVGTVEGRSFLGANIRLRIRIDPDATIDVVLPSIDLERVLTEPGAAVRVAWEQRFRNVIGAAA
jgi:putative spermidine/putrescine transport system ATP-binding protein